MGVIFLLAVSYSKDMKHLPIIFAIFLLSFSPVYAMTVQTDTTVGSTETTTDSDADGISNTAEGPTDSDSDHRRPWIVAAERLRGSDRKLWTYRRSVLSRRWLPMTPYPDSAKVASK